MHIAFLTPEYPHLNVNHAAGIGTSIKNLTSALVKEGITVTVLVYGQKTEQVFEENGIKFHLIKNKKYQSLGWLLHRKYINKYCQAVIEKEKIDVIEAPDWTGITAFMKFTIPLVIRLHGSDTYFCHLEQRKQKWKNFFFEKWAIRHAAALIAPTNFAGEVSKKLFKIKNKKIQTIHYGLDLTQFENKTPKEYQSGLILYVGTIIRKKGVLELPAIFSKVRKQFPDTQLLLIGSDAPDINTNSNSTWEILSNRFPEEDRKKVTYIGKKTYAEVQQYIQKTNVCIFPTFAETLGMVTIEAMAMQKAVVNSSIGWSQELLIDGESGFLVHPLQHDAFAEKIVKLLQNNVLCQKIGLQARARVEAKFDIKKVVKENIEYYQQLIKSTKD